MQKASEEGSQHDGKVDQEVGERGMQGGAWHMLFRDGWVGLLM